VITPICTPFITEFGLAALRRIEPANDILDRNNMLVAAIAPLPIKWRLLMVCFFIIIPSLIGVGDIKVMILFIRAKSVLKVLLIQYVPSNKSC
jgi:hypothetical protein